MPMSVSVLARMPLRRSPGVVYARSLHATASTRSTHGDYHHLPFKWPGNKKGVFAAKLSVFLFTGFSIPFIASAYQLKKAAAA